MQYGQESERDGDNCKGNQLRESEDNALFGISRMKQRKEKKGSLICCVCVPEIDILERDSMGERR